MHHRTMLAAATLAGLALLLAAPAPTARAAEGPPYFDPDRSMKKQADAAKEAVDVVRQGPGAARQVMALLADVSGVVRDRVFHELRNWSDQDLLALADGLKANDEVLARNLAELYGDRKLAGAREALEGALRRRDEPLALVEVLLALGQIGDPASVKTLEKVADRARDPRVAAAGLLALTRVDAAGALARLEAALGEDDPTLRMAALARLRELDEGKAAAAAVAIVRERPKGRKAELFAPRLLFAALEVLAAVRGEPAAAGAIRDAIPALIERLGEEEGRPRHDIAETLRRLTGQHDLGDDPPGWKTWWEAAREEFDPASVGDTQTGDGPAPVRSVVRYHGIPIYSKRIAFVLDLSGGMDRNIDPKDDGSMRRLDYAKQELIGVLEKLEDDVAVNVFFFGSTFDAASKQLVPLKKARRAVIEFVRKTEISSDPTNRRSNVYDPLVLAIEDPIIDTVFLLSEGGPSEGLFQDKKRFLHHLKQRNLLSKTRVHTLYIGASDDGRKYVEDIAEAGGGRFYDVNERIEAGGGGQKK